MGRKSRKFDSQKVDLDSVDAKEFSKSWYILKKSEELHEFLKEIGEDKLSINILEDIEKES